MHELASNCKVYQNISMVIFLLIFSSTQRW